jgi:tight adherence protein C
MEMLDLPLPVLAGAVALFAAVTLAVVGLAGLVPRGNARRGTEQAGPSIRFTAGNWVYDAVVRPLAPKLMPAGGAEIGTVRRKLIRAGWYAPQAVPAFYVARMTGGLALPFGFTLAAPLVTAQISFNALAMGSAALAMVGYLLPAPVVNHRTVQRQIAVKRSFPDALDLLLVCVEAGLGLDAAINRVAQEVGGAHPVLHEHFHLMALELQTGKSREQALRALADRIGIEEVDGFCTLLIQSDSLGASIAGTLRTLSDDMRAKRMLQAEEKAQQVGVKLTFPLILMIMPALMLTIGAPAIIQMIRQIGPIVNQMGSGG